MEAFLRVYIKVAELQMEINNLKFIKKHQKIHDDFIWHLFFCDEDNSAIQMKLIVKQNSWDL